MTVGVNILVEKKPNTYTVPAESVVSRNGDYFVYVLRDGKPVEVEVQIGIDHPVKFRFGIADDNGRVEFLLAPRIEAD